MGDRRMSNGAGYSPKDRESIREQVEILHQHLSVDEIDIEFVRLHVLMLYQCVASRSEVVQLLRDSQATVRAVIETVTTTELANESETSQ